VESTPGADLLCHVISGSAKCVIVTNLRTYAACHPDDPALAEDAKSSTHSRAVDLVLLCKITLGGQPGACRIAATRDLGGEGVSKALSLRGGSWHVAVPGVEAGGLPG